LNYQPLYHHFEISGNLKNGLDTISHNNALVKNLYCVNHVCQQKKEIRGSERLKPYYRGF
jgi:hypothetical protein